MKIRLILFLLAIFIFTFPAKSSGTNDTTATGTISPTEPHNILQPNRAFTTEASYVGDLCANMAGGIKTGLNFLGMANLKIGFNTGNAGLWNGGQFFINGAVTHGQSPSASLIGDFQVVSNIDADDHIYLHELWYSQSFGLFSVILGIQDLNAEFAASENGGLFLNSSFGIPPVISDNIPAPIFPLTAPGITVKLNLTDAITFSGAVYDGCPTAFELNAYNTAWHLNREDGTIIMTEIQWATTIQTLPGTWKAGYYYHSGLKETDAETGTSTEVFEKNYGFYMIADQTIWKKEGSDRSLSVFGQLALSPANINTHRYYMGGGINYTGFSEKQPSDALGIAVASAGFNKRYRQNETTIELYCKKQIGENLFIQPDIQYVINPAGTDETLPNALVGILRFGLNF